MPPALRKLMLTVHITCSVGLLGAVAGFLALAIAGLGNADGGLARAAYLAMDFTARLVVLPLAFAALLTGIVQSLGTRWGLFRHYWVLMKLVLTLLVIIVLLMQMEPIARMARLAADADLAEAALFTPKLSLVVHAAAGLMVLLAPMALSVYKPNGRTPLGRRRRVQPT